MDGGWEQTAPAIRVGSMVAHDKLGLGEVVAEADDGTCRVRLQDGREVAIKHSHLRLADDPFEHIRDDIRETCAKRGLDYGMRVDVVGSEDPWIAEEGKLCVLVTTGRRGIITGWADPVRWDDRRDKWVPCREDHPGVHYRELTLRDADGVAWTCTDLDNLFGADGSDAVPPSPPLRFLSYDEMVALPDPAWLVDGLLMERTSALLFGRSNSFKSFLGVDIAGAVSTGRSWHGHTVRAPGPVLYVATEGALGVAKQRIPGWMEAHDIPLAERGNLYPQEIALDSEADIDALLRSCALFKGHRDPSKPWDSPAGAFRLIVVDIFGASMNGPEVSDETARVWVRNVNRIMREVGCAMLTVAHTGWADETRARMHTHFWGSFDTRLKAEGDKDARSTVLSVDRHKDADSTGRWGFRLEETALPDGGTTLYPCLSDDVEADQRRRVSGKPAVALQALSESLIEHGRVIVGPNYPSCPVVSIEQWRAYCGRHGLTDSDNPEATRKAFNRARTTLLEKGLIRQFDSQVWTVASHA